jgi:hypothetical protein
MNAIAISAIAPATSDIDVRDNAGHLPARGADIDLGRSIWFHNFE